MASVTVLFQAPTYRFCSLDILFDLLFAAQVIPVGEGRDDSVLLVSYSYACLDLKELLSGLLVSFIFAARYQFADDSELGCGQLPVGNL